MKKYIKGLIRVLGRKGYLNWMTDEEFIRLDYWAHMNDKLNLKNPQTFNQKLQWIKLYDRNPMYTKYVDKYEVKKLVAEKIGEEYIIPTIGVWDYFDDINFEKLPKKFVLKCTHDSGGVEVVTDKDRIDIEKVKVKLEKSLNKNFFYVGREWPYKDVKPRIIAEVFLESENTRNGDAIWDYKVQCFNGKPDNILVCAGRNSVEGVKFYYFDLDWNFLPYSKCVDEEIIRKNDFEKYKPKNLQRIIEFAQKLSEGIPEVRVDFYEVNNKVYFGEMTFFSSNGLDTTITDEADRILGMKLDLPSKRENN